MKSLNTMSDREKQDKKVGGNKDSNNSKIESIIDTVKNEVIKIHEKK